jgi:hypothetical protein
MDRKIYVVMGETGEYSNRGEWPVLAFFDEAEAKERVIAASRRAKEIEARKDHRLSSYRASLHGLNEYDPKMDMDYTGTRYYIMTVTLSEKAES